VEHGDLELRVELVLILVVCLSIPHHGVEAVENDIDVIQVELWACHGRAG
jgi:hypothetical protein